MKQLQRKIIWLLIWFWPVILTAILAVLKASGTIGIRWIYVFSPVWVALAALGLAGYIILFTTLNSR